MTTDRFAEPQLFEVWRMAFRYEDQPEISKERPVIIGAVNKETDEVLLLTVKVTGHAPRSDCAGEVVLEDWQEAGLENRLWLGVPSTWWFLRESSATNEGTGNCLLETLQPFSMLSER